MKKLLTIISVIAALALVSCSSVFYGNISGRIIDEDTEAGIQNATVYLYQDKGARDSAFEKAKQTGVQPASGYYTTALTGQDGSFSISKIYWKTNSPEYGKTADKSEVYLMYYKKGYGENGFTINANTALIISESSGGGIGEQRIKRTQNIAQASIRVLDVLSNGIISDPLSTAMTAGSEGTSIRKINDRSFEITTSRDSEDPVLEISWNFRSEEAAFIPTDKDGNNTNTAKITLPYDNPVITLYAKPTEFTYPVIEGKLITTDPDRRSADNITVKLLRNGIEIASTMTENRPRVQGDESQHGSFTIEVPETEKWTNTEYQGRNLAFPADDIIEIEFTLENKMTETLTFTSSELIQGIKYITVSKEST